ncbi:MAG: tetratricopeptide repeat protein, partial [Nocardioidaceae bacterium]
AECRPEVILSVNLRGYDPQRAPVEPISVLDGFLRSLGEPGQRIQALDLDQRARRYRELLATRSALILLDNAGSEDQIEPLLPTDPAALVIVTSRHRVVRRLSAKHLALETFTSEQALDLLRRRAGGSVDAEPETAARIVEQVGRLPLAVALVGSRIKGSPGWTMADHFDHLVECGESLRLDQGVELAFATSYQALPPSLRRMLRRLALHPGRDCDAYAAAVLADVGPAAAEGQLGDLVGGCLLSSPVPGRFELHDLVRIFALNRARDQDPPSGRRDALTRLLDHYRWAATIAMDMYAPAEQHRQPASPKSATGLPPISDQSTATAWLKTEQPNLLATAIHAADHGWPEHASGLSAVLAPYLLNLRQLDTAEMLHRHASRVAAGAAKGVALKDLATSRWHRGRRREARALLAEALDIAEAHGDRPTQSRALMNLAVMHRHMGHYTEAIDANLRAINLFRRQGDKTGDSRVLGNLGIVYAILGQWAEAMDHQRRALALTQETQDDETRGRILENLARLRCQCGQYDEAVAAAQKAARLAHRIGDRVGESEALTSLGLACAGRDELDAAATTLRRALSIAEAVASRRCAVLAHNAIGETMLLQGRPGDALTHHHTARTTAADLEDPLTKAHAHQGLLRCYAALGDAERARSHGQQALAMYTRLGVPDAGDVASYLQKM